MRATHRSECAPIAPQSMPPTLRAPREPALLASPSARILQMTRLSCRGDNRLTRALRPRSPAPRPAADSAVPDSLSVEQMAGVFLIQGIGCVAAFLWLGLAKVLGVSVLPGQSMLRKSKEGHKSGRDSGLALAAANATARPSGARAANGNAVAPADSEQQKWRVNPARASSGAKLTDADPIDTVRAPRPARFHTRLSPQKRDVPGSSQILLSDCGRILRLFSHSNLQIRVLLDRLEKERNNAYP